MIAAISHLDLQKKFADKGEVIHGYFDEMDCVIYVDSSLKQNVYERVLMHEITHAVLNITGLSGMLKGDTEESLCTALENLVTLR